MPARWLASSAIANAPPASTSFPSSSIITDASKLVSPASSSGSASSKRAVPARQAAAPPLAGPDAELLALRPEFHRLRAAYYGVDDNDDAELSRVCEDFDTFCSRVGAMPAASTSEGQAFKAICALHQIYYCTNDEEFWDESGRGAIPGVCKLLRELIGDSFPLPPREEA